MSQNDNTLYYILYVSQAERPLSDQELASYLSSGDWQGKAGGYAIQGPAGAFVS